MSESKKPNKKKMYLDPKYIKDLNNLVDEIFICAKNVYKYTHPEFAKRANLNTATVYRIAELTTRLPRLHTIWKLAKAVGMELTLTKKFLKIKRKAG